MTRSAADVLADAGLEPLGPIGKSSDETRCRCTACGTTRWVRVANLRRGGIACRWCHGWAKWSPWGEQARRQASTWRAVRDAEFTVETLASAHLRALTPVGDEFTPVGVECLRCGETTVVVPERIVLDRGWNTCDRCSADRKAKVRSDADDVFRAHGLRLLGPCRGEFVPQACECLTCGSRRAVSFRQLVDGTAPLCWSCTYGIRPDEPHRVYLVRFAALGVLKVGLTHARHDRRLGQHEIEGGEVVQVVTVPDRAAARSVERSVLAVYEPWRSAVGPLEFPQGGWTETWIDDPSAPECDLEGFLGQAPQANSPPRPP